MCAINPRPSVRRMQLAAPTWGVMPTLEGLRTSLTAVRFQILGNPLLLAMSVGYGFASTGKPFILSRKRPNPKRQAARRNTDT